MRKLLTPTAIALGAILAACSHGTNTPLPQTHSGSAMSDVLHQKEVRETQRIRSAFVAPKHPGSLAEAPSSQNWATGIREAGQAPVPGGMFDIVNQYSAMRNGQLVTVYAGSLKTTGAGIVLVVTRSADLHTARAQTYTVASGAVRISGLSGDQLELQTAERQPQRIPFRVPL